MSRRGANSTLVLPPDLPGGNSSLSQPRAYWQLLVEYGRVHEIEPRALGRPRARARRPRCSLAARFAACPSPSRARLITAQREVGVAPGEGAAPSRAKPNQAAASAGAPRQRTRSQARAVVPARNGAAPRATERATDSSRARHPVRAFAVHAVLGGPGYAVQHAMGACYATKGKPLRVTSNADKLA